MGRVKDYSLYVNQTCDPEDNLTASYFHFLCDIVGVESHYHLCDILNHIAFYSDIHNDENRIMDALYLRKEFIKNESFAGYFVDDFVLPVSVLEVLVVLAMRCEEDFHSEEFGDRTGFWFFSMLRNAGLIEFDDDHWMKGWYKVIRDRVYYILDRKYTRGCRGGFFPLRRSRHDQRFRELWFQMLDWLNENFKEEYHI